MKEVEYTNKDVISIVNQKEQKKETRLIGSIKPNKGHILFEINNITGEIKQAIYEKVDVNFLEKNIKKRVIVNKDCYYISALNKLNAIKKYKSI